MSISAGCLWCICPFSLLPVLFFCSMDLEASDIVTYVYANYQLGYIDESDSVRIS